MCLFWGCMQNSSRVIYKKECTNVKLQCLPFRNFKTLCYPTLYNKFTDRQTFHVIEDIGKVASYDGKFFYSI